MSFEQEMEQALRTRHNIPSIWQLHEQGSRLMGGWGENSTKQVQCEKISSANSSFVNWGYPKIPYIGRNSETVH